MAELLDALKGFHLIAAPHPRASDARARPCTCHPDDNPPTPCAQKYAYSECANAASDAQQEPRTHTTQGGESLAGIALRQCGNESHWRDIIALNPDFSGWLPPDYFPVGTVLKLPPKIAAPQAAQAATIEPLSDKGLQHKDAPQPASADHNSYSSYGAKSSTCAAPLAADSAAPAGAGKLTGWQPIETAPRNGVEILIWDRGVVRVGFFDVARGNVWSVWPGRDTVYPAHWMPVPGDPYLAARIAATPEAPK